MAETGEGGVAEQEEEKGEWQEEEAGDDDTGGAHNLDVLIICVHSRGAFTHTIFCRLGLDPTRAGVLRAGSLLSLCLSERVPCPRARTHACPCLTCFASLLAAAVTYPTPSCRQFPSGNQWQMAPSPRRTALLPAPTPTAGAGGAGSLQLADLGCKHGGQVCDEVLPSEPFESLSIFASS